MIATVLSFSHSRGSSVHDGFLFTDLSSYSSVSCDCGICLLSLSITELVYHVLVALHHTALNLAADPQDSKATQTPSEPWQVQGTGFIQIVK